MLPRASGDLRPSKRRAKKLSFEWANGSLSDFPVRKLAKTACCLDPGMVHTGLLPSTIPMCPSPKYTSQVRNPFRCTSHECACPINYPVGYYWYSGRQQGIGHHPKWIARLEPNDDSLTSTSDDEGKMQQPTHQQRYALRKRSGHGTRGESL